MEHVSWGIGVGAGMAALAFWGFVAVAVIGGIWNGVRKRETQHETVRRLIESGQAIDQELMDKLLLLGDGGPSRHDRDFIVTGLWLLPVAVGLGIFGLILGADVVEARAPLLGAAALTLCISIGTLVAGKYVSRWYPEDSDSGQLKD